MLIGRYLFAFLTAFLLCVPALYAQQDNSAQAPASMSELAQRGVSLKVSLLNPSAGVYTGVSDLVRQDQYARVMNNLQMTKRGVWTSRGIGYTLESAQLQVGTVNAMAAVGSEVFTHVKDKVYLYNVGTHSAGSDISTALFDDCQSCIRPTGGGIVATFYNNNRQPAYGGGGGFSTSVWPVTLGGKTYTKPKFNENFQTRQAYAGFSLYPYTVLLTNADAINSYTVTVPLAATDAGAITFPSVLGRITSLRSYRYGTGNTDNVLIVGCEKGVGMISGTSALNFISMEISREFGIVSNETFQELEGELYFLASDGIRKMSVYNDSGDFKSTIVSQPVNSLLRRLNVAAAEKAFSVHHPSTQEMQFWFPIDSDTQNQNCVIMNYNTRSTDPGAEYQAFKPAFSSKNGFAISAGANVNGTMYGGKYDGYITKHYDGDTYEGGAINWQFVSPMVGANSPAQNASLKKFVLMTDGPAQKFTAAAYTLTTNADDTTRWIARGTRAVNVATQTIADIDTWATGNTTSYPKLIDFAPMGSGRYWTLKLSGAATDEHISLVGLQAILNLGGWKQ